MGNALVLGKISATLGKISFILALGRLASTLRRPAVDLGAVWAVFSRLGILLGATWAASRGQLAVSGAVWAVLGRLGTVLGRLGGDVGAKMGPKIHQKTINILKLFQDRLLELCQKVWNQLVRILGHLGHLFV